MTPAPASPVQTGAPSRRPAARFGLIDEIRFRLEQLGADEEGVRPPVLALGVFERVGSNWFLATVSQMARQHNEPFRQQLHPTHRLSALNVELVDVTELECCDLEPFELHWLVSFVVSKYSPAPGHLVKETNLFFAVGNLLRRSSWAPFAHELGGSE